MVKALPFTHHPDRLALKASDVSVTDCDIKHVKNCYIFLVCYYSFSQG